MKGSEREANGSVADHGEGDVFGSGWISLVWLRVKRSLTCWLSFFLVGVGRETVEFLSAHCYAVNWWDEWKLNVGNNASYHVTILILVDCVY